MRPKLTLCELDIKLSPATASKEMLKENTAYSRHSELKYVVESLFEQHDHSHLNEEVCQTTTGMALQNTQRIECLILWSSYNL